MLGGGLLVVGLKVGGKVADSLFLKFLQSLIDKRDFLK